MENGQSGNEDRCIADELSACSKIFRSLLASPKSSGLEYTEQISYNLWKEEFDRLRTWSANIGAHQRGNTSLDFRLRDASHIQSRVVELVIELHGLLSDTVNLLEKPGTTGKEDEEEASDEEDQTEYQELYSSLVLRIDCLFDLSLVIRKPAKVDRLAAFNKVRDTAFSEFDLRHVEQKFPYASQELQKGLASAITVRRSVLKYYENHQGKYARGIQKVFDDENARSEAPQTEFSVNAATEYRELDDAKSTSGDSNQSMRSIMNQGRALHIPIPPEVHGRKPYTCPCCHYLLDIYDPRRYARHVFEDITPYQCIFENCAHKQDLIASKSAWLRHVTMEHSNEWHTLCTADGCFMCGEPGPTTGNFAKHVARHLEDLAMFVLPSPEYDKNIDDDNSGEQAIALQDISDGDSEHDVDYGLKDEIVVSRMDPLPSDADAGIDIGMDILDIDRHQEAQVHNMPRSEEIDGNDLNSSYLQEVAEAGESRLQRPRSNAVASHVNRPKHLAEGYPSLANAAQQQLTNPAQNTHSSNFIQASDDQNDSGARVPSTSKARVPDGARQTKISRVLVNPKALKRAQIPFEEREDWMIVQKVLSREDIQKLADETRLIREKRKNTRRKDMRAANTLSTPIPQFSCRQPDCHETFGKALDLSEHEELHGTFKCFFPNCRQFASERDLNLHLSVTHKHHIGGYENAKNDRDSGLPDYPKVRTFAEFMTGTRNSSSTMYNRPEWPRRPLSPASGYRSFRVRGAAATQLDKAMNADLGVKGARDDVEREHENISDESQSKLQGEEFDAHSKETAKNRQIPERDSRHGNDDLAIPEYETATIFPSTSKRYYCDVPGCVDQNGRQSSASRKADLERHMNSVHAKPMFDCEYSDCERRGEDGFLRDDHYQEHLRGYHGKVFATATKLKQSSPGKRGQRISSVAESHSDEESEHTANVINQQTFRKMLSNDGTSEGPRGSEGTIDAQQETTYLTNRERFEASSLLEATKGGYRSA